MAFLLRLVGTLVIAHVTLLLAFLFFRKYEMAWKEKALISLVAGIVFVIADLVARAINWVTGWLLTDWLVWFFVVVTAMFMMLFTGQVLFDRMGMGPQKSWNLMLLWFVFAGVLLWLARGWLG